MNSDLGFGFAIQSQILANKLHVPVFCISCNMFNGFFRFKLQGL